MAHILTTGVPVPPDYVGVPSRMEIVDFVDKRNIHQFSLYVQAVNYLMSSPEVPETAVNSWFSVAGIHGDPIKDWNGVKKTGIFCEHGNEHFPTWHRPYVATLEQFIQERALIIAGQYTEDRAIWLDAAKKLRQPYWDWASPNPHLPPAIVIDQKMTTVEIRISPKGEIKRVANPFIFYRFRSNPLDHPAPSLGQSGDEKTSRTNPFNVTLRVLNTLKTEVEKLMALVSTWDQFSNNFVDRVDPGTNSLEILHDQVHGAIAGYMGIINCAAFDPIFWLHHCNVDRLLHFWYQKWNNGPTDVAKGQLPFWKTQTEFWPSGGPNLDTKNLGYTYSLTSSRADATPRLHNDEWDIQVESKKFEVGGSYAVYFFLGSIPEYGDWDHAPERIGTFHVFANSHPESCGNCQDHIDGFVQGAVDITDQLVGLGHDIGDAGHIVDYLGSNLKFAVKSFATDAPGELPSLKYKLVHIPLLGFPRDEPDTDIPFLPYPKTGDPTEYEI